MFIFFWGFTVETCRSICGGYKPRGSTVGPKACCIQVVSGHFSKVPWAPAEQNFLQVCTYLTMWQEFNTDFKSANIPPPQPGGILKGSLLNINLPLALSFERHVCWVWQGAGSSGGGSETEEHFSSQDPTRCKSCSPIKHEILSAGRWFINLLLLLEEKKET